METSCPGGVDGGERPADLDHPVHSGDLRGRGREAELAQGEIDLGAGSWTPSQAAVPTASTLPRASSICPSRKGKIAAGWRPLSSHTTGCR